VILLKKRKNTWLLAGILVMVFAFSLLMALNVAAAPAPLPEAGNKQEKPVTIEVANVMAKPGDLVDITYKVKDNAFGFSALDLLIPYDSNVYTPETVKAAGDLDTPNFVFNEHYAESTMRIAFAAKKNVKGDGLLFTVTCKIAATAPCIGDYPLDAGVVKMQYATKTDIFVDLDVAVEAGCLVIGILGDVNGDGSVTPEDAILILQMLVGLIDWTPRAQLWGDINGDGIVDTTDAALILRIVVGCEQPGSDTKLLYQGRSSLRFTAKNGTVMYLDPYIGDGYDLPADIILITHEHYDHNDVTKIETQNPGCKIIRAADAIADDGTLRTFKEKGITIEAVEAENSLHTTKGPLDPDNPWLVYAVGYIITIDGIKVYVSGDTDTTCQMQTFAAKKLDYAFLVCDGQFNMGPAEAAECAKIIAAKHNIPYHTHPDGSFDIDIAKAFAAAAPNSLILKPGREIILVKK
jgi:L-ascorbate metabolism protein UlaG (beta-lactamase superfamily)